MTSRELEILRLVAAGHPNHEIAARLVLSKRTIDHHVSSLLGKLGVARRAGLANLLARPRSGRDGGSNADTPSGTDGRRRSK